MGRTSRISVVSSHWILRWLCGPWVARAPLSVIIKASHMVEVVAISWARKNGRASKMATNTMDTMRWGTSASGCMSIRSQYSSLIAVVALLNAQKKLAPPNPTSPPDQPSDRSFICGPSPRAGCATVFSHLPEVGSTD